MRPQQIETWAISIADRVRDGQRVEDTRVELKATWPDPTRAARQIAGHANASRGDPVLWLIGVDEDRGVTGAEPEDMANWWPQVESQFDGVAPEMTHLSIPYDRAAFVAIYMDTDRAPYVVRNPNFGTAGHPIALEVPWRDGTKTRTATRADLIRTLTPLQRLPSLEILDGYVAVRPHAEGGDPLWTVRLLVYIVPEESGHLVLPGRKVRLVVEFPGIPHKEVIDAAHFQGAPSPLITSTGSELIADGAGQVWITASKRARFVAAIASPEEMNVVAQISPAGSDRATVAQVRLRPVAPEGNELARWAPHDDS
jgi:hypothetical protein